MLLLLSFPFMSTLCHFYDASCAAILSRIEEIDKLIKNCQIHYSQLMCDLKIMALSLLYFSVFAPVKRVCQINHPSSTYSNMSTQRVHTSAMAQYLT